MKVQHKFVEFIPKDLEDGILYISLTYGTVLHSCACGCGNRVNTPLGPNDWKMIYDGQSVTLKPSIGNWSFDCKSHYWITKGNIEWSDKWDYETIREVRKHEDFEREEYYKKNDLENSEIKDEELICKDSEPKNKSWFQRLFYWN